MSGTDAAGGDWADRDLSVGQRRINVSYALHRQGNSPPAVASMYGDEFPNATSSATSRSSNNMPSAAGSVWTGSRQPQPPDGPWRHRAPSQRNPGFEKQGAEWRRKGEMLDFHRQSALERKDQEQRAKEEAVDDSDDSDDSDESGGLPY